MLYPLSPLWRLRTNKEKDNLAIFVGLLGINTERQKLKTENRINIQTRNVRNVWLCRVARCIHCTLPCIYTTPERQKNVKQQKSLNKKQLFFDVYEIIDYNKTLRYKFWGKQNFV